MHPQSRNKRLFKRKEFFERLYINKQNVVQAVLLLLAVLKKETNRQKLNNKTRTPETETKTILLKMEISQDILQRRV